MCPFDFALSCWRKTSSCWRFSTSLRQGTGGKLLLGKEREWVRGGRNTLALARQTIVQALSYMHLCGGCKAADYPCKALKNFGGSTVCAKHTLVRESGGIPFPLQILGSRLYSYGQIWWLSTSQAQVNFALFSDKYYSSQTTPSRPPDLHKLCGISCTDICNRHRHYHTHSEDKCDIFHTW